MGAWSVCAKPGTTAGHSLSARLNESELLLRVWGPLHFSPLQYAVTFASYGRPGGACAAGSAGATSGSSAPARAPAAGVCHAASSQAVARSLCVGLSSCTVTARAATFGADPCPGRPKRLIAQVACAAGKAVG